jgi:hypothetical protein
VSANPGNLAPLTAVITAKEGKKDSRASARESESLPPAPAFAGGLDGQQEAVAEADDGFAEFWSAYPKHAGKLDAQRAFSKAGAKSYQQARLGQDERYTKHPAKWLRDGCWLDEESPQGEGPPIIDNHTGEVIQLRPATGSPGRQLTRYERTERLKEKLHEQAEEEMRRGGQI